LVTQSLKTSSRSNATGTGEWAEVCNKRIIEPCNVVVNKQVQFSIAPLKFRKAMTIVEMQSYCHCRSDYAAVELLFTRTVVVWFDASCYRMMTASWNKMKIIVLHIVAMLLFGSQFLTIGYCSMIYLYHLMLHKMVYFAKCKSLSRLNIKTM
jgi:hypothetical protein